MELKVFHISAECYPVAKVGGLADVVGALPKYQRRLGTDASVILPKYHTKWTENQQFETVFENTLQMGDMYIPFAIQREVENKLGFPLYVVDIPHYFDRPGIYGDPWSDWGYADEPQRFISFQIAVLDWIRAFAKKPDIIHCHDHHTGLIPFMMTQCPIYDLLKSIPTVLTVHNAEYQGRYDHSKEALIPYFDESSRDLLDWSWNCNSLAAGLKCCWQITTVSPSYMEELRHESNGLEYLFAHEAGKSRGILNGIDSAVWNPNTDDFLDHHFSVKTVKNGKLANKKELCQQFGLDENRPLIAFIGRLVEEKGADLLPDAFSSVLDYNRNVSFLVLGTGRQNLHDRFRMMSDHFVGFFDASLSYNEKLAHKIYAGSDFMIMPSRVEPCGLNQMYCMRYGTIPIVRNIGGLKDTVKDISEPGGYGFTFNDFTLHAAEDAIVRAIKLYNEEQKFCKIRKKIMKLEFSWNVSAGTYIDMYKQIKM